MGNRIDLRRGRIEIRQSLAPYMDGRDFYAAYSCYGRFIDSARGRTAQEAVANLLLQNDQSLESEP